MSSERREAMAVIDRFEDDQYAVLLLEEEGTQIVVPSSGLPEGAREGNWLHVVVEGENLIRAHLDADTTQAVQATVGDKMNRLRQRGRSLRD